MIRSTSSRMISSASSSSFHLKNRLSILPSVEKALTECQPVVALESTIISHGMKYPENLELCQRLATILKEKGVEPATIALHDGKCKVGLSEEQINDLASANKELPSAAVKCSTRDLSLILSAMAKNGKRKEEDETTASGPPPPRWGATTVASTMVLANAAGISTFVTGGIGGVHRNGQVTMDVSADLLELGRTPVVVVSAGIKSILDIARTLEVLETQGVPVVAYQSDEMPAFFSPHSGVSAPSRVDSAEEVAESYWAARDLGLNHGMLVAVPNHDPAGANVEAAIQAALGEAEKQEIHGAAVTPFVLKRVAETTGGASLRSNIALVQRNAEVGADIAIAINEQKRRRDRIQTPMPAFPKNATDRKTVVVLGGIVMDVCAKPISELLLGTSNPSVCSESDGGVARNIAEVLGRMGEKPLLYSAVGNDSRGRALLQYLEEECHVQANETTVQIDNANTASYTAVLDRDGDLHTACADMAVLSEIPPPPSEVLQQAEVLVMDANPPISVMRQAAFCASESGVPVYLDPTSVPKAKQIAHDAELMSSLSCMFPNTDELHAMAFEGEEDNNIEGRSSTLEDLETQASLVLARMNLTVETHLVVTMGQKGVLLASRGVTGDLSFQHFRVALAEVNVTNATGAGDSLCGTYIHAILHGKTVSEAVHMGMKAAVLSLSSSRAISERISPITEDVSG